jgi:hypothetical protein
MMKWIDYYSSFIKPSNAWSVAHIHTTNSREQIVPIYRRRKGINRDGENGYTCNNDGLHEH